MPMQKEIDPRLAEYIRERLRNECSVRGGQASIARDTGFSQAAISKIRSGDGRPGYRLFKALADHWGTTTQAIEAHVLAPSLSKDDPYPSRAEVAERLRLYFPHDILEALASVQLPPGAGDPGPIWWSQFAHTLLEKLGKEEGQG